MAAPTLTPDRQTFPTLVADVAAKAKATLPQAVKLVLQGDVEPQSDGSIQVGTSSDPTRYYRLTGTACTCTDFVQGKSPEGWCKHRIAAGIATRVGQQFPHAPLVEPAARLSPCRKRPSPSR